MNQAFRCATAALLAIMCFMAVVMLLGLVTVGLDADRTVVIRFLAVASFPFFWIAAVLAARRKMVGPPLLFGLSAVALLAFIGAIDFANGRELYSGFRLYSKG